ncbi:MAG TPA: endonuclease V [candidate division Zixibacteria bacterium]|nr:endonuclease V [candidate division Zixibacteria bacterium]
MKPRIVHDWPRRMSECAKIQKELLLPLLDLYGSVPDEGLVLGIEAVTLEPARKIYCAATLMRYPGFTEVERNLSEDDIPFPFSLELNSFREGRVIVKTLEKIQARPDLIMVHGDGINNPSGVGLACHLGIIYEIPAIGCFRRLRGAERPKVGRAKGAQAKIVSDGREVAVALRSKEETKPIFVSPGYKISLDEAVAKTLSMLRGFRTPEPIRVPHLLATRQRSSQKRMYRTQERE